MRLWLAKGTEVAWLIDIKSRIFRVSQRDEPVAVLESPGFGHVTKVYRPS